MEHSEITDLETRPACPECLSPFESDGAGDGDKDSRSVRDPLGNIQRVVRPRKLIGGAGEGDHPSLVRDSAETSQGYPQT